MPPRQGKGKLKEREVMREEKKNKGKEKVVVPEKEIHIVNVEFIVIMDEDYCAAEMYLKFINYLRELVTYKTLDNGLLLLHPPNFTKESYVDCNLKALKYSIVVRIRFSDLYIIGYQVEGGQWYEFGKEKKGVTHEIPKSEFLGFAGTYSALHRAADSNILSIQLGKVQLFGAIAALAKTKSHDGKSEANNLLVIILMIAEAMRFSRISNFLASNFEASAVFPPEMIDLVKDWSSISYELLNPNCDITKLTKYMGGEEAIKVIAVLLNQRLH